MIIIISDNSVLSCLAELGELGELVQRLAQTKFRLAVSVVEDLRRRLAQTRP